MTSMKRNGPKIGGEHLARKSELAIARQGKPPFKDILVVEDESFDADRLRGTLNTMFNYKSEIRHARTLGLALDCVIERKPDIVFLDDQLKPSDNAMHTIPFLRRCGYDGPIVVVSSVLTRPRMAQLIKAGAVVAIHKDDLDSGSIGEALKTVIEKIAGSPAPQ